eukprot:15277973-Alexandrium_andersonii.AAC.1
MPWARLRTAWTRHLRTSSSAYSWAVALSAADGVACCCATARAPRLSEMTDTGVARETRLQCAAGACDT